MEEHAPGSFCWIELATTDRPAAKNFYASLFGWSAEDSPMGPGDFYTTFRLEGREAAGGYTLRPGQRAARIPPHWAVYVAVPSADAAAARATELGGKIHAAPFDVTDLGRMAVIEDPTAAVFCVWEAKKHAGLRIAATEGAFCVADLSTGDQDRAAGFYARLFGWRVGKEDEDPAHNYYHLFNGETFIGGILPAAFHNPQAPPHWIVYFQVSDCGASAEKVKQLGGRVYLPPMTVEDIGRISVLADPLGAVFALFQPR